MKTILFLIAILAGLNLQAQTVERPEFYLNKSQHQKKTAKILAISGGSAALGGLLIAQIPSKPVKGSFFTSTETVGYGLGTVGVIALIAAVPTFVFSKINRNKAVKYSPAVGFIQTEATGNAIVSGISVNF